MYSKLIVFFFLVLIIFVSCQQETDEVIATKIQYDVNIKSPDLDYDWWIQNLPGPQREKLVELIIDGALSGKFKAYDYFNNPITTGEVGMILSDTSSVTIVQEEPPYAEYDTLIIYNIEKADIERIRFLEEWKINADNLQMDKKILGIAPIAKRMDWMGVERWQPLFWIYIDEDFVKQLNQNN